MQEDLMDALNSGIRASDEKEQTDFSPNRRVESLVAQSYPEKTEVADGVESETLKPIFVDESMIMQPQTILRRLKAKNGRYYYRISDDGKTLLWYVSVTNLIDRYMPKSEYLIEWMCNKFQNYQESRDYVMQTALYGSFMHMVWGMLLQNETVNTDYFEDLVLEFLRYEDADPALIDMGEWKRKAKQDIVGFIQWKRDYKITPIAIEFPVYSDEDRVAGMIDIICEATLPTKENPNYRTVIQVDLKTGRQSQFYDDHKVQNAAYNRIWNKMFPYMEIERIFNYGCKDFRIPVGKTVTPYRFQEWSPDEDFHWRWESFVEWSKKEGFQGPQFAKKIRDGLFNAEMDLSGIYVQTSEEEIINYLNLKEV